MDQYRWLFVFWISLLLGLSSCQSLESTGGIRMNAFGETTWVKPLHALESVRRAIRAPHAFVGAELRLPSNGNPRVKTTFNSVLSGFATKSAGASVPTTLHVVVERDGKEYPGVLPITADTIHFEIIGNEGDVITISLEVLDQEGSLLGTAVANGIILSMHTPPVTIDIMLASGEVQQLAIASVPITVRLLPSGETVQSSQKDPISIVPMEGLDDGGEWNTLPTIIENHPPIDAILWVVSEGEYAARLEMYDFSTGKVHVVRHLSNQTLVDVAVDWEREIIYFIGYKGLSRAPLIKTYENGEWKVSIGTIEALPRPRLEGWITGESPEVYQFRSVLIKDENTLYFTAPNPFYGTDVRMWEYDLLTGKATMLNDDHRPGERMVYNPKTGQLLYGERARFGHSYMWSFFQPATSTFTTILNPPVDYSYPDVYLLSNGVEMVYISSREGLIRQHLHTGAKQVLVPNVKGSRMCWSPDEATVVVLHLGGQVRKYNASTGALLYEDGKVPATSITGGTCEVLR